MFIHLFKIKALNTYVNFTDFNITDHILEAPRLKFLFINCSRFLVRTLFKKWFLCFIWRPSYCFNTRRSKLFPVMGEGGGCNKSNIFIFVMFQDNIQRSVYDSMKSNGKWAKLLKNTRWIYWSLLFSFLILIF